MKVLITGATGLVGKKLVQKLTSNGIAVNYLTHSKKSIPETALIKAFYWNLEKETIDKEAILNVDAIIHLAGATVSKRWTPRYQKEILNSRVNGIKLLIKTLQKNPNHQVKHFISASGISIYPSSLSQQYNEFSTSVGHGFLAEVVQKWEQAVNELDVLNIKTAKIRTGLVLDPHQGAFPIMYKTVKNYVGANFGNGKQIYSWIHIDDLVGVYQYVLQNKLEGVYNAVASNPVSANVFLNTLAKASDTKIWLPNIPSIFLNLGLGQMSSLLLDSQYVLNDKIKATGFVFKHENLEASFIDIIKKIE